MKKILKKKPEKKAIKGKGKKSLKSSKTKKIAGGDADSFPDPTLASYPQWSETGGTGYVSYMPGIG